MEQTDANGQAPANQGPGTPGPPQAPEAAAPELAMDPPLETAAPAPDPPPLEAIADEVGRLRDQVLRQAAEFQNYRRRSEKEKASLRLRGQMEVIEPLLSVLDDFRRSLDAADATQVEPDPVAAYESLKKGVELVYQNFADTLKRLGVEPIDAVGQPFDEHQHEALMQQPAPEGTAPGTVIEEFLPGYRLGERVLRHSRVVVAA